MKKQPKTVQQQNAAEQARKKRKKNFKIFLALFCVVLVVCGSVAIYNGSGAKYNKQVKSAYNKAIKYLKQALPYSATTIDGIRFYEPEDVEQPAIIEIFATLDENGDGTSLRHYDYFYELEHQYYTVLKEAERAGDYLRYANTLLVCFNRMELVSKNFNYPTTNFEFNTEQAQKFNEFFNLNEYGLNQVGFLPQHVNIVDEIKDGTRYVTYAIKGLSFVETETGKGDGVLPKDLSNAVLSQKLNKNNIKVYETDFEFTYDLDVELASYSDVFLLILRDYFSARKLDVHNLKVVPTYVNEVDLTVFKMQVNVFNFTAKD